MLEEFKALLETQLGTSMERLSRVEAAHENRGGRIGGFLSADQAPYPDGATADGDRTGSVPGRRGGVATDNPKPAVGEVGKMEGSTVAMTPMEISSIKTSVPNLGGSEDFPL